MNILRSQSRGMRGILTHERLAERGAERSSRACRRASATGSRPRTAPASFVSDRWQRPGGGGGLTRVLADGAIFEKGGRQHLGGARRAQARLRRRAPRRRALRFFATGVSLVLHPKSPRVPTVHANFRCLQRGAALWFGGGADLTPYYPEREDVEHFHRTWKTACDRHDPATSTRASRSGATTTSICRTAARRAASAASSSISCSAIRRATSPSCATPATRSSRPTCRSSSAGASRRLDRARAAVPAAAARALRRVQPALRPRHHLRPQDRRAHRVDPDVAAAAGALGVRRALRAGVARGGPAELAQAA